MSYFNDKIHGIRKKVFIAVSPSYTKLITTLCLKKRPTCTTCYNFYIHSSIATVFGINVVEKVGNQNVLYVPTTPN